MRTLLSLQNERATGTLRVDAEGVLTVVRLRDGHPVFVEGGLPADSLGRLLVSRGQLTEGTLAEIEEHRMVMQGRLRFGEVARRIRAVGAEVLNAALHDQVGAKLARCLHWERSQHAFLPEDHGVHSLGSAPHAVEPLLLRGVALYFTAQRVESVLACALHGPLEMRGDLGWVADRLGLSEEDRRLCEELVSTSQLGELLRGSTARRLRLGQLAVVLALTDQIRLPSVRVPEESGPFALERPRARNLHAVGPGAAGAVEIFATRSAGKEGHPLAPIPEVDALPGKDKLLADSAFLQGKELLRAGEHGAAADAFREAANLRPGAREYALFAAWSAYLSTGRAQKWRDMLVELCEKTLEQDRLLAFAHHVKGQLALEVRDVTTARDAFLRAVELDPGDDEARARLAKLSH